jgi:hypothetical protein
VSEVRTVFLNGKDAYTFPEAGALLGWLPGELETAVAQGMIASTTTSDGVTIAWEEVATILTTMHSQAIVEDALGTEAHTVMPELVRLAELRVQVPRFEVVMLRKIAERERTTIDDLLASHLLDLAGAESEWLNAAIPGFRALMRWPER